MLGVANDCSKHVENTDCVKARKDCRVVAFLAKVSKIDVWAPGVRCIKRGMVGLACIIGQCFAVGCDM